MEVTDKMLKLISISILALLLFAAICYPVFAVVGDVNGDGHVDGSDLIIVARAFGSTPVSPRWNPSADLNHDGYIDGIDLIMVAAHFGQ
jgi:Ca2+-binding EF-hand superfamily protein